MLAAQIVSAIELGLSLVITFVVPRLETFLNMFYNNFVKVDGPSILLIGSY